MPEVIIRTKCMIFADIQLSAERFGFFNAKLKYNLSNQPHNDFNSFLKENGTDKGLILTEVSKN